MPVAQLKASGGGAGDQDTPGIFKFDLLPLNFHQKMLFSSF